MNNYGAVYTIRLCEPVEGAPYWTGRLTNTVGKELAIVSTPEIGRVLALLTELLLMEVPDERG